MDNNNNSNIWSCNKVYFTSPGSDSCLRPEVTEPACCSEIASPETENRRPIPSSPETGNRRPIPSSFVTGNRLPIPSSFELRTLRRCTTVKTWPSSRCRIVGTDPSWRNRAESRRSGRDLIGDFGRRILEPIFCRCRIFSWLGLKVVLCLQIKTKIVYFLLL